MRFFMARIQRPRFKVMIETLEKHFIDKDNDRQCNQRI